MTVSELIDKLQALTNKDATVMVNVRTFTRASGQAQVSPWDVDQSYQGATIHITLPAGQSVVTRKTR